MANARGSGGEGTAQDPEVLPSDAALGAFDSGTIRETMAEDPLAVFVMRYWRQLLIILGVVVLAYFAVQSFKNAAKKNREDAADTYLRVRDSYAGLISDLKARDTEADAKKKEELSKEVDAEFLKFNEAVKALSNTQAPYKDLAELYRTLGTLSQSGDLATLAVPEWKTVEADSSERFVAELHALTVGRALLDGGDAGLEKGRALLQELAKSATVVHSSAAVTLADIAITGEERAAAKTLLQEVLSSHPDQAEIVEPAMKRLG